MAEQNTNINERFAERIKAKKEERENWDKMQRVSHYDRQVLFSENGQAINENNDKNKNPNETNTLEIGNLYIQNGINNILMATKYRPTHLDLEKEELENKLKSLPDDHPDKHKIYRIGDNIESNYARLKRENELNNKVINRLNNNKEYNYLETAGLYVMGIASGLFGDRAKIENTKAQIKREELATKVKHIEDYEKRADTFYAERYKNMHMNDGYGHNKVIRNLRVGEKPQWADKLGITSVNEKNVTHLPIGIISPEKLKEINNDKEPNNVLKLLQDNISKNNVGTGAGAGAAVLLNPNQENTHNFSDWVQKQKNNTTIDNQQENHANQLKFK